MNKNKEKKMLTTVAEISGKVFYMMIALVVIIHMLEFWFYNSCLKDYQKGFIISIAVIFTSMTVPWGENGFLIKACICFIPIVLDIVVLLNFDINEFSSKKAATGYKLMKTLELLLIIIFFGGSILLASH